MSFDIIDLLDIITSKRVNQKKTVDILETMQSIWKFAHKIFS